MNEMLHDASDKYDQAFDRAQDLEGLSPDEARRKLGPAPYPIESYQIPALIEGVGQRSAHTPEAPKYYGGRYGTMYGEEAGVGYEDGVPPEWQHYAPVSDEQQRITRDGAARVVQAQEEARQAQLDEARAAVELAQPDTRNFEQW